MFKKRKAARSQEDQAHIESQAALQKGYVKSIADKFTEIEKTTDAADKILKLQELQGSIGSAQWDVSQHHSDAMKKAVLNRKTAGDRLIAAASLSSFYMTGRYDTKKAKLASSINEQNPYQATFDAAMSAQQARATKMLEDTVRTCKLDVISESPRFAEAFKNYEPLRNRFEAAAAARAALGDKKKPSLLTDATPAARTQPKP